MKQCRAAIPVWVVGAGLLLTPCSPGGSEKWLGPKEGRGGVRSVPLPTDYFTENAGQVGNEEVRFYMAAGRLQMGFAAGADDIHCQSLAP